MKKVMSTVFALMFVLVFAQSAVAEKTLPVVVAETPVRPVSALISISWSDMDSKCLLLEVGNSKTLKAVVSPKYKYNTAVKWKSGDPSIAVISAGGVLTAKRGGYAEITCSLRNDSKIEAKCKVFISDLNNGVNMFGRKEVFFCGNGNQFERNYLYFLTADPWQCDSFYGYGSDPETAAKKNPMYHNTVRLKFYYDGMNWMIMLRKGQYRDGFCIIGSEIRVYTKPITRIAGHYACADFDHRLMTKMTLYQNNTWLFTTDYKQHWWDNGFYLNKGLTKLSDRTELTVISKITFYDAKMTHAFVKALEENGFRFAAKVGKTTPDTHTIRENSVCFNWKNLKQPKIIGKDAFYSVDSIVQKR